MDKRRVPSAQSRQRAGRPSRGTLSQIFTATATKPGAKEEEEDTDDTTHTPPSPAQSAVNYYNAVETQFEQELPLFGVEGSSRQMAVFDLLQYRVSYISLISSIIDHSYKHGLIRRYIVLVEHGGTLKWASLNANYIKDELTLLMIPLHRNCHVPFFCSTKRLERYTALVEVRLLTSSYKQIGTSGFYVYDPLVCSPVLYQHATAFKTLDTDIEVSFSSGSGVQVVQASDTNIINISFCLVSSHTAPEWAHTLLSHVEQKPTDVIQQVLQIENAMQQKEAEIRQGYLEEVVNPDTLVVRSGGGPSKKPTAPCEDSEAEPCFEAQTSQDEAGSSCAIC